MGMAVGGVVAGDGEWRVAESGVVDRIDRLMGSGGGGGWPEMREREKRGTAEIVTNEDGNVKIHATIDGHSLSITEGSIRRHLKLDDKDGLISLPSSEIFAQLALMGYATNSDKLTTERFIQLCLDMQRHKFQQHSRFYSVPSLTMKVFSNMKRSTKGFSGQEVPLFPSMLDAAESSPSPSKITSSPSPTPSSSPTPEPSPTQPSPPHPSPSQYSPTQPGTEYHPPTPNDSPLHAVHSHGREEGSLKLQELMGLITTLSDRIGVLEADLSQTKKIYSSAYTKLILRVKKLESQIKVGKARRHSRFVLSDTEVGEDDSSKQGRKFSNEGFQDDEGVHEKASTETELFIQEVTPTEIIHEQEGSGKVSDEISTAGKKKDTASEEVPPVSTAEVQVSTAGGTATLTSRRRCKKEKIRETALRLEEQMNEEQRAQIARDAEIARQWEEEEKKKAMDEAKTAKVIDWNDPSVIRYHSLKMKPRSIAQARRNMIKYLKNQGNFKINDFKGMSYNEIRPIFEKLWDFNQRFVPMDAEKERTTEKIVEEESVHRGKRIDQGVGSTSGIRACALRYFDLGNMELENSQNNSLAKLPILKLGEYEMWEIRIKQYFQIQDYALWEVIEYGNSWVPIPITAPESGPSTALKMTVPSTTEEKICKKNDVKARSLLLMALPNEHQLTFNQYADAQSMFIAIKARFGGNDATKKTQKALLKQQYENFNATSSESLDSIFNRLQKLVSRLAILGVDTSPEDLNVKFLRSLPSEWDTHVVVWMNKPDFETMGLDDLYNNFKIVEQKVKRTVAVDDKNLAFLTTTSPSSTNPINTVNTGVSTGNIKVNTANTASTETSTASFSDATVYAFLSTQPQGSQLVHEDLEQIHDDDLEEMDLKWNMALLSMRARKFYQRTGRKIIIDGSSTAGYDKSKVECFNCHKMGHFARECRVPRSKDNRNWNQGNSSKAVRIEDASEKAMCAIDGGGFDWSDMAEDEIQANMALMAFSDSEVSNDKSCSKTCLQNYEALKKQYDDLLVKLDDTAFKASTYKRGLSILEAQVVKYKESEVLFSEEIALLKRSVGHKDYLMGLVKTELEKVKEEKEGFEFKLAKFEKSSKDLDDLLASQVTDKSKRGFGYTAVPSPHPLILNRPTPLDLSYSGLEEFKQPEVNGYGPRDSGLKPTTVCNRESNNSKENTDDSLTQQPKTVTETSSVVSPFKVDKAWKEKFFHPANHVRVEEPQKARENTDAPIIEDWVSDDEEEVESIPKVEKKIPTATKKESVKTVENPIFLREY
ncbi:ribonuclease H-like domain-containing protein [Tanacetum coccineum]